MHEDKVYRVGEQPLLNGLFGVSNQEWVDSVEVLRIIMNLTPSNAIFRGFDGDVGTLPPWAGISPLHLPPHEQLLISSEDVRAFILHRFRAQSSWHPPFFYASTGCAGGAMRCKGWTVVSLRCSLTNGVQKTPFHCHNYRCIVWYRKQH